MRKPTRESRDLVAFYDLSVAPTSFDFATFLMQAEWRRNELGPDRKLFSVDAKCARLERLSVPLGQLFAVRSAMDICDSCEQASARAELGDSEPRSDP
jgi:hypothetical protein